jgi:hypothetical protein
MRFLTRDEARALLAGGRIAIDAGGKPVPTVIAGQRRIEAGQVKNIENAVPLAEALIRWLPADADRILWLTSWRSGYGTPFEALRAMRDGLGATSEISHTPVCHFAAQPWTSDQLEMTIGDSREAEALVGMIVLAMVSDWDCWLLSTATDEAIEFWERKMLFHAGRRDSLADAEDILRRFETRPPI